jgi:hypothetical protein
MVIVNVPLTENIPYDDMCEWIENNNDLVSVLAGPSIVTYYIDGKPVPPHAMRSGKSIFNGLLFGDEQDAVYFKLKFGL